jgi:Methylase involved in ubiquinone/menaquinone biosynthesis
MTPGMLPYLADPVDRSPLALVDAVYDEDGCVETGHLVSTSGRAYPVVHGIPRFAVDRAWAASVDSFGDQWNRFNFIDFREHWLKHTVANTFGTSSVFAGRVIVDAGAGSGAQTLWMLESGARHVIALELSPSVDDVMLRNLRTSKFRNWDILQCSIDAPPVKPRSVEGIVICHNVIQHTPSVARTATALFDLVAPGGEFVFNCYPRNDVGFVRWLRFHAVYKPLRAVLRRCPRDVRLAYASSMAFLRQVPVLGTVLEKLNLCVMGDVVPGRTRQQTLYRRFAATRLNTFDYFGAHAYQHHLSERQLRELVRQLQPSPERVENVDAYFSRPQPIGCALRIHR